MSASDGDDQPLPLRVLARRVRVPESTLRSWENVPDRPLRTSRAGRGSVTSTVADVRAFCAAHDERHGARRAAAHLDGPITALDAESLHAMLEAVIAVVRVTAQAHLELADTTATAHRAHAATLTSALRRLDATLTGASPTGAPDDRDAPP